MFTKDSLDYFKRVTKYDLNQYFDDVSTFVSDKEQNIINYYSGNTSVVDYSAFQELARLLTESNTIEEMFYLHRQLFDICEYVEIYDNYADLVTYLKTIDNASKWLKSTITRNNFNPQFEQDFTLKSNQTVESLASEVGYGDRNNDWVNIALRNNLTEDDYELEGGQILKISFQNNLTISIQSIVDNPVGQQIYGLDIQKKFEFESDDLKTLTYYDTFIQTVGILLNLKKGDNPEFPTDGIPLSYIAGNNINSMYYPALFRQITDLFAKDDTIKNVAIVDLKQNELKDGIDMEISVESRINDVIKETFVI